MSVTAESLANTVPALSLTALPERVFYRDVTIRILLPPRSVHPNDGTHSGNTGGRYNSPQNLAGAPLPTTYFSSSRTLGAIETEQANLIATLGQLPEKPRCTYAVVVRNAELIDLRQPLVQNHTLG